MKRKKLSCIALLLLMFFALGIVAESVALAAPIGEWKFDEGSGTTAYDSSGKGKTGTITGATWIDGLLNKALKFAGSTNYVKVPQSLDGLSNWSFTAYIKPTGTGEVKIYSEKDDKNNFYLYISITADDRIKVGTWHGKRPGWDIYQTPANQIKRNEWSHLCVTLENGGVTAGSGTVKCYVNRILVEPTGHLGSCQAAVPVTGVSLNKTSTTLNAGSTETLIATVSPANASNKNVTWSSSNTNVATVSTTGTVTAKTAGTATITVRTADGGYTANCTVTVYIAVTGVSLNKTSTRLVRHTATTGTLVATVFPTNAANKNVTWSSSNTGVATVDANGKVTAGTAGTATITVRTVDGGYTATCTVTVRKCDCTLKNYCSYCQKGQHGYCKYGCWCICGSFSCYSSGHHGSCHCGHCGRP